MDQQTVTHAPDDIRSAWFAVFLVIEFGLGWGIVALQATVMFIRSARLNMPIIVPDIRPDFANWLGMPSRRQDLVIRFSKAPTLPMSLRRSADDVIVA
jgi:hypothetical protein